jgi:hypothetical protein
MDLSHELASIYAMGFVINLYLILLISVQIFDVMGLKFSSHEPNRQLIWTMYSVQWAIIWIKYIIQSCSMVVLH